MVKRLCKYNRSDIADRLGEIHSLVIESKFLCRFCARSSSDKESLCKPFAIPSKECQDKPISQKRRCAVLVDTLTIGKRNLASSEKSIVSKTCSKKAEKVLKKQEKYQKKLKKVLKKQKQLIKKQHSVEKQFIKLTVESDSKKALAVEPSQLH